MHLLCLLVLVSLGGDVISAHVGLSYVRLMIPLCFGNASRQSGEGRGERRGATKKVKKRKEEEEAEKLNKNREERQHD